MQQRILTYPKMIQKCRECPYLHWQPDNSSGNHDGVSQCKLTGGDIEWDTRFPAIPKWCPLPKPKKWLRRGVAVIYSEEIGAVFFK